MIRAAILTVLLIAWGLFLTLPSTAGLFDQIDPNTGKPVRGRMSTAGWQACVSCHPAGLTDGVVFQFAAGPRKSIPMDSTFNPHDPTDQRFLNYSALNDEVSTVISSTASTGGLTM